MGVVRAATSWPFVIALAVLLANDLYLKAAFPSWLTGKLSDLSGIFFVSLALFSVFPRATHAVAGALVLGFAFWKSPLSQPLIDAVNSLGLARFGRVVDYGDLIALILLPLACRISRDLDRYQVTGPALRKALCLPIFAVTLLAVMGTSVIPYQDQYSIRRPGGYEPLDAAVAASIIADVAKKHGMECVACERMTERAEYRGRSMSLSYLISEQRIIYFTIEDYPGMFFDRARARMQRMRQDLQGELGTRLPDMEFVLPLPERGRRP